MGPETLNFQQLPDDGLAAGLQTVLSIKALNGLSVLR